MSYVLEALKKADAERERGAVPDLHARPLGPATAGATALPGTWPWRWIAAAAVLLAAGVPLWLLLGDAPERGAPAQQVAEAPSPAPAAVSPTPPPPAPAPAAAPVAGAIIAPAPPAPRQASEEAKPKALPAASAPAIPPAASAPAEPRIYLPNELPEEIRRTLPNLAIGGAMHSPNAASRMLIVNGQLFREKDMLMPELQLEQITLKAAVLRYKGYLYRLTY
jgi:general secretion pathway protein B